MFVTTGRLIGGAPLAAQQYRDYLRERGELDFEVWDREKLVELISVGPESALSGGITAAFLSVIGQIGEGKALDSRLEEYSRNWFASEHALMRGTLETAVIASSLRRVNRLDLAAFVALCLIGRVRGHSVMGLTPHGPAACLGVIQGAGSSNITPLTFFAVAPLRISMRMSSCSRKVTRQLS